MTTATASITLTQSDDATFRAWGSAVSALLSSAGLVQTSDTGQINWTTVTRASGSSDAGYEIWRFNDTMQSTLPIYMKFLYGSGTTNAIPRLQVIVGLGSNGSGTITTSFGTQQGVGAATTSETTARTAAACHVEGSFGLHIGRSSTSSGIRWGMSIARTVDSDGTPNGSGIVVMTSYGGGYGMGTVYRTTPGSWVSPGSSVHLGCSFQPVSSTFAAGTLLPVFPVTPWVGDTSKPVQPTTGMVCIGASDATVGTTLSVSRFGTTRTYLATDVVGPHPSAATYGVLAFLWE